MTSKVKRVAPAGADTDDPATSPVFLRGGGEMGAVMRRYDWSSTPLGSPWDWPQSLRTVIRLLLNTRHPMFVFWGTSSICFYNDAYSATIGPERHPSALGQPGEQVWAEIWDSIGPQIELVMAGRGATWNENQLLPITRHGRREDVYWTYSYSPIDADESASGIGGVMVMVTETTEQVLSAQREAARATATAYERDRFTQLFAKAPSFMALLSGPTHRFELANDAYMRIVGERDILGRTVADALPDAMEQGFVGRLDDVYRTGEAYRATGARYEVQVPGQPPDEHFVDFIFQPLTDEVGAVTGIFVEGYDTTDRTRAETALEAMNATLRHSEEEFRALGEHQANLCWMANADGWIYWFNRRWYDYTGTTPEAMLGWGWQTVHDPDMLPLIVEKWTAALASGTVFEMIFPLRGIDGVLRPFLTRIVPLRDADGVITRWFGNNVDISEQQASEAALRESEARFRVLADSMPQMVWSALPDGFHDYYNARWYEFTGVPSGSTDGEGWNGMFHADDQARANARWRHSLATGEPYEIEYRLRRHDGVYRWTLGRALPLLDETGRITRWVGTCTDIDDTKQVAEMLARNRLELERLVEERTAALLREVDERRKAEEALHQGEKLQAIGQLTGGIAHDFNNILQVVTSGATLLSRPSLTEDRRTVVLAGMKNAAQSAKDLTGRLLAFARKQSLKPKVFDLNSRLFGMSELLRHTLGSRIRVETSLADDLWLALADPGQLEVAILNLAMNARDAMLPKGGVLRFETHNASLDASLDRAEGDYVCLVVRDTGTGMPDSVLARVFEPFFTTKGLGRGTGLGLAQVHGFSKQSGGDIAIESTQGEGTVITLHLPRAAGVELESLPSATSRDVASVHPMQVASGRTVLVVEDNADVAAFAAGMLEGIGYKTRHAANAADALMLLESGVTLDAVFTDVMMPGELNGVQLAVMIRARFPALAVVLASGYSEAGLEWGSEAVGELLDKPYRLDELEQALERAFIASADRNFFRSST